MSGRSGIALRVAAFLMPPVDGSWGPGGRWRFAYARTLPGYPTDTSDVRP
jgi:hypothetical protein